MYLRIICATFKTQFQKHVELIESPCTSGTYGEDLQTTRTFRRRSLKL